MHERTGMWRSGRARAALAGVCTLPLALAGCGSGPFGGSGDDSAQDGGGATLTETTTMPEGDGAGGDGDRPNPTAGTTTATEGRDGSGGSGGGSGNGSGGGSGENCGVDVNADVIFESIATVDPPFDDGESYWEFNETNFDPCGELTYALFHQMPQGNSQFGTVILMFHDGEYLGIDSVYPQQAQIMGEGDGWFEVKYRDWEALRDSGQSNVAAPYYNSTVSFEWDEEAGKVATSGRFPNTGS